MQTNLDRIVCHGSGTGDYNLIISGFCQGEDPTVVTRGDRATTGGDDGKSGVELFRADINCEVLAGAGRENINISIAQDDATLNQVRGSIRNADYLGTGTLGKEEFGA